MIILESILTFWTLVAWSNKQIDLFFEISILLRYRADFPVFRSLQQSHSSTVVFCDKAAFPQTSLSHRDSKDKRYKIPFRIWLVILGLTCCKHSLKWILNAIQDIILIYLHSLASKPIVSVAKESLFKQFLTMFILCRPFLASFSSGNNLSWYF